MAVYIYVLIDPRDGAIRYVGRTVRPLAVRRRGHVVEARSPAIAPSAKAEWVRELLDGGVLPEIAVVEETTEGEAPDAERRWIARYEAAGTALLNVAGSRFEGDRRAKWDRFGRPEPPPAPPPPPPPASADPPAPPTPDELRAFRRARRWSQGALARRLGYHYSTVSLWESGRRPIPPSLRLALERLDDGRP